MKFDGGKGVVERILKAYGFTMQKQLHDHLDVGNGTVSTWIKREYFPGEVVIRCALETGASLTWLATGEGEMFQDLAKPVESAINSACISLKKIRILGGRLQDAGTWSVDSTLLDDSVSEPAFIEKGNNAWIADMSVTQVSNGRWLLDIDGDVDVYDVARIPGNRIQVSGNATKFECSIDEVKGVGMVVITIDKNI
ncbi:phage repressor protein CI [Pectobacterium versatile]|uniref:phage repressor protein CI n=1 Tax=Pectobacterium versatile TaxID=2488639 RepID=UPI001FFD556D|nr:phage repressor protein CI [Pectobacterium versatile]MBQ4775292.1 CI repressor [Pectobacterium versatile]